jgi:hypothetical protein
MLFKHGYHPLNGMNFLAGSLKTRLTKNDEVYCEIMQKAAPAKPELWDKICSNENVNPQLYINDNSTPASILIIIIDKYVII